MRNLKKFLALVLAMLMVVSAAAVVSADFTDVAADARYADAINDLAVKGIVKGTSDTTFGPDQDVKRWQMALFVARAMTGIVESDADWANGHVQYVDVTEYKGAIEYVHANGVINGWADPINGDPVFGPNDGITYVQALKMAVCALGYTEQLDWPWGYYNKAASLGLTNNLVIGDINDTLDRAETAQVIYNMIYAAPANGGLTMAETNFSIKTPDNTTMFVVVATPKQYYAKADSAAGGDRPNYNATADVAGTWVGIQPLVNGVANGQIVYLPCEQLGIAAGEVEDYFNRTVELINYDKATGEFTGVELGAAPVIVNYSNITLSGAKIKYNGVTYTPSTSISGATLINEIVVYNDASVDTIAKVLPTDADGNIINGKGEVVATVLYTNANGTKWYFDENNGYAMSEEDALDEYGVFVKDEAAEFVRYNTINGNDLKGKAYQLEMYDDNGDGDFERAVVRNIYMGVYYTELANISGEKAADGMLLDRGILKAANTVEYIYADGVEKKAQETGSINVYTYNPQRNRVHVLAILELQEGNLTKIDAKGYRSDNDSNNTIKLTFDGKTTLTIGYSYPAASINGATLGADLIESRNVQGKNDTVLDVAEEAFLHYYFDSRDALTNFVEKLNVGENYAFYAYNGYILMIDQLETEVIYNFAVMEEFVDFDFGEVYVDMYVGADFEEEALVTVIDGKDLSKLSNYKFSMLISKQEYFYPGTIYEVEKVEDAYELYDTITADNYKEYGLLNAKAADDNYDEADATKQVGTIVFDNGSTKGDVRANRLRTNSNTVFYFIEEEVLTAEEIAAGETPDPMNTTVTAFYGNAGDNEIGFDEDTQIWVDSLGTANDRASVVYVINPTYQTFTTTYLDTVWAMMFLGTAVTTETVVAADELGDAIEYYDFDSKYLYKYSGNFYNMDTGEKFGYILSEYKLNKSGSSYRMLKVDENNVAMVDENGTTAGWNSAGNEFTYIEGTRDYAMYGIVDHNGNGSTANAAGWGTANGSLNYFDWLYYHKMNIDVDDMPKVPSSILDVALVEDIIDAEYDDGIAVIVNLVNDTVICDEDTKAIDEVIVIDLNGTIKKNEEALDYLMSVPQIVYCNRADYMADGSMVFVVASAVADK